jgi:large subunit ribosomal protein L6
MSRIGKLPIQIPSGVTITVDSDDISVKGPKGELTVPHLSDVTVTVEGGVAMQLGFSHPVKYKAQDGVQLTVNKMEITVGGIDKQKVGQVAAEIRALKKPEPYKGKGIKYADEQILRKAGKAGK